MERVIAMMKEEKARLAEWGAQMAEDERRKRDGEGPAAARTEIVGTSTCVEDQMPAQDTNGRA
jgi:hypothetical protein